MSNQPTEITRIDFKDTLSLYSGNLTCWPEIRSEQKDKFLLVQSDGLNYTSTPFQTTYYQISICTNGYEKRTINGSSVELTQDALLFLSPRHITNHSMSNSNTEAYDLLFTRDFLLESKIPEATLDILLSIAPSTTPVFRTNSIDKTQDIFKKVREEAKNSLQFYRQIVRYSIIELLFRINRIEKETLENGISPSTQGYKIYREFKSLVDNYFKTYKSVNAYAELLHVTPKHLSEVVKQQSGDTALDLIHNRILTEAKNLLGFTDKLSKQIAYDLGFQTPSYFSRFFKKKTGLSPSTYRKNRSIEH